MSEADEAQDAFAALPERLRQWIDQGALTEAGAELEQLLRQGEDGPRWFARGELALRQGEPSVALLAYERALLMNPASALTHARLGRLLLGEKAFDAALRHFEAARAFAPEVPAHTLALIELYLLLGDRTQAMTYSKEALSLDSGSAEAFALLGRTLWLYGRWPEAQAALLQSRELEPGGELAAVALLQLALRRQDHAQALALLLDWPAGADSAEALYLQACCQYWQGDHPAARALWYAALEQGSDSALLQLTIAAPLVSLDQDSAVNWQALVEQGLELLAEQPLALDQPILWPLPARLPAIGVELLRCLGQRFQTLIPVAERSLAAGQTAFRVGLICSNLADPALSDWALQWLGLQAHDGLSRLLFYLFPGEIPPAFAPWAEQCFQVPDHGEALARLLRDFALDALLYLDLDLSLYYLALCAPAPLQLLLPTWPGESGLASLPAAQARLELEAPPLLALAHAQPSTREAWSLPMLGNLYLCPLPPQNWLPDFDPTIRAILAADRKAFVIGLQQSGTALHTRVMQRQAESLGERAHRVKWLDVPAERLPELISLVDLVVEPADDGHPWAGFQALSLGVPVLSAPGGRSRPWLARLGLNELMPELADLAARAVDLLTDRGQRAMLRERLLAGRERLLDQADVVSRLESGLYKEMTRLSHDHHP